MNLFARVELARTRWNVLHHPFYRRWDAGALSRAELAFYAGEYRHAVVALAGTAEQTATQARPEWQDELRGHALEEAAHVGLWDTFADGVGGEIGRAPLAGTSACAEAWLSASDEAEGLVTLYAIEAGQPAVSLTKLNGLANHYGVPSEAPAASYFRLHAELDHAHAAHSRRLLERCSDSAAERLAGVAERAVEANWKLLDGVESEFGR